MWDVVFVHDLKGHDGVVELPGSAVIGEGGGEGGQGEGFFLSHRADGVPHGLEKPVAAEDVDHQVPGLSRVLVGQPGPLEELYGGEGVVVGEFEDLYDDFGTGDDSGGGEGGADLLG